MRRLSQLSLLLVCSALAAARPAHAQLSELTVRLHSGLAMPFGAFGGFYDPGVSVAFDAAVPLRERLDLVVDLGLDYINSETGTYVPDTHLWRMQVEVEGDLVGDRDAIFRMRPFAGIGAVYFHTKDFQIEGSTPADRSDWSNFDRRMYPGYLEKIEKTFFTGTGGLRLGLDAGDSVTWWLSGKLTWSPVGDAEVETLRRVPLGSELTPFGSATNVDLTLGLTIRRP
jgi:hypothetical protein